jgi:hypothetical protein
VAIAWKLSSRLAAAHGFVVKLWKLTAPYFWSEERWSARGLLAIVVGGNVFLVYLAKLLNEWNARFFTPIPRLRGSTLHADLHASLAQHARQSPCGHRVQSERWSPCLCRCNRDNKDKKGQPKL